MPTYEEDVKTAEPIAPTEPDKEVAKGNDYPPDTTKRATRQAAKPSTDKQLKDALDTIWVGVGGALLPFDSYCGATVITNGPEVTDALIKVSKKNPRVRQALESFATTSAWGAVAGAFAGILLPVAAHHKIIPAGLGVGFGPDNETLEDFGIDTDALWRQMMGFPDDDEETTDEPDAT